MKLQLFSVNNRYAFAIGRFSSLEHFMFCPDIKPSYQYAWEAYKDAKNLYKYQYSHIDSIHRIALDDISPTEISADSDTSAEEMVFQHYSKILDIMNKRVQTFKDEKDKELVYNEIKSLVSGVLKVKESLEKDEDKIKIEGVLNGFRKIVKDKFAKLLAKDKEEMDAEKEKSSEPVETVEDEIADLKGDDTQGAISTAPESDMAPITANNIDRILKYASHVLKDIRTEVLDNFAERACQCIENKHPDAICKIDYDEGTLKISKADGEGLLKISVNEDLNVTDIEPDGNLSASFPLHSFEFYQRYWKPMVEKIGHCLSRDIGVLICPAKSSLPDIPNSSNSVKLSGWSISEKKEVPFEINFGCKETPVWLISKSKTIKEAATARPSKYTEEDFIRGQPRRVECIDSNLKSIFGKIGEVVQIIPLADHIEIDVNFGRQVVRLTENQIELIEST